MKYHNQPQTVCENCGGIKSTLHRTNANGVCYNIHKSARNARHGKAYHPHIIQSHRATNVSRESFKDSIKKLFGFNTPSIKQVATPIIHADKKVE